MWEMVLGQGFCICRWAGEWERERKKQVQCTGSRIAQLLKVKKNWFERLFIVAQKLGAGVLPLEFRESPPTVDSHPTVERWGQGSCQN